MNEARIIIPDSCVDQYLLNRLIDAYGGATILQGTGAWHDYNNDVVISEPVHVVDVAGTDSGELYKVAQFMIDKCGQDAVYIRDFNGRVEIVTA